VIKVATKDIYAIFDKTKIRVYQAYNNSIADEAVKLNKFGESFNLNRMTWIKPSFLWMMYRSNWGLKRNQERILAVDILRTGFDDYLSKAILTTDESVQFLSHTDWEKAFRSSDVYCQWDPDRDIWGNAIGRSAIQIGIRGQAATNFIEKWICQLTDITSEVNKWRNQIKNGGSKKCVLPKERLYPVPDNNIRKRLHMM
jgi:hypothetical protein